ncbi:MULTISPECIES: TraR/DksA family transcriptional regulator [Sphingomonadaceae]|uniref:TraR/DksA family transcriptional regulator n=1 Tax=Sphingomonadales TaxID=204457 RepID=UPI0007701FF3|nr:TraR/DksA C4-type zinc finger protein [Sphingobium sp. TKS]AMK23000.1 TraR/DksA family transcriptional regulator [Sphingobium sp. TKS]MCF8706737.1 TraR/DksA C4-type zinc finger protein [Rhizorhapis sp. SPR117]
MPDLNLIRYRLTDKLRELNAKVARIEEEQGQPLDDDFEEQAVAREDDEALDAVEQSTLAHIALTQQALARLDAGTYGLCTNCGKVIAAARLEALPAAAQCIRCASSAAHDRV